jgi:hypothetical protein
VWSMYFYYRANQEQKTWLFITATAFLSLAILAKLPYIVFAGVPFGFFIIYLRNKNVALRNQMLWSVPLMIPAFIWYFKTLPGMQGNATLAGIFTSSPDGIPLWDAIWGNISYLLPVIYLGYATIFLFATGLYFVVRKFKSNLNYHLPFAVTCLLLLIYFIYEGNLIGTVHDYYMLPFVPILMLIAAKGFHMLFEFKLIRFAAIILVLATPFVANSIIQPRWNPGVTEYCHDLFQYRDELRAAVPDTALVVMGNDPTMNIMPYYIDKKGWTYVDNELQKFNLECYIRDGATFLYTNSEVTLQDTSLRPLFKREVAVYGIIHVFELMPRQIQ